MNKKTFVLGTLLTAALGFAASSAMASNPTDPNATQPFTAKTAHAFHLKYSTPKSLATALEARDQITINHAQQAGLAKSCLPASVIADTITFDEGCAIELNGFASTSGSYTDDTDGSTSDAKKRK